MVDIYLNYSIANLTGLKCPFAFVVFLASESQCLHTWKGLPGGSTFLKWSKRNVEGYSRARA